ncbi:hypothetical protein [Salipiger bermudensis]|uniref:hypothetical protein n=1 Tax=Salipiger bermudensis TaxID=344736 RepID=UPI001CD66F1C|nr:hypothetical protein [Salipiger bermudensis]MCA0960763.1 hypothetical protein [Salipiger bermudensis]
MTRFFATLITRLDQRARYTRTLRELRRMSLNTALDLGISRGDLRRIASEAVYGRARA